MRNNLETNTEGFVALQSFYTGLRAGLEGLLGTAMHKSALRELRKVQKEELKYKTLEMISRDRDTEED